MFTGRAHPVPDQVVAHDQILRGDGPEVDPGPGWHVGRDHHHAAVRHLEQVPESQQPGIESPDDHSRVVRERVAGILDPGHIPVPLVAQRVGAGLTAFRDPHLDLRPRSRQRHPEMVAQLEAGAGLAHVVVARVELRGCQ